MPLDDTIAVAFHDMLKLNDVLNSSYWSEAPGSVFLGRCHTFQFPNKVEAHMITDGLIFGLDPNKAYVVLLHDPNYFLLASNPLIFPRIWLDYRV